VYGASPGMLPSPSSIPSTPRKKLRICTNPTTQHGRDRVARAHPCLYCCKKQSVSRVSRRMFSFRPVQQLSRYSTRTRHAVTAYNQRIDHTAGRGELAVPGGPPHGSGPPSAARRLGGASALKARSVVSVAEA